MNIINQNKEELFYEASYGMTLEKSASSLTKGRHGNTVEGQYPHPLRF